VQARRGGFGGGGGAARPKRRFVNSSPVCVAAARAPTRESERNLVFAAKSPASGKPVGSARAERVMA